MVVAASITTFLSWLGIPISLAMATVMCIVGSGWGRATRVATARDLVRDDVAADMSVDATRAETAEEILQVGEENPEDLEGVQRLLDESAVIRFVSFWIIEPSPSTILSYIAFVLLSIVGTP